METLAFFFLCNWGEIRSPTLEGCGNVTAEDTEFARGGADFMQRLFEPGNVPRLDVNKKLIFPRAAVNGAAFNFEQVDTVPGKRLE